MTDKQPDEQAAPPAARLDRDPSDPSRTVPYKRANQPFLVQQKWEEEQRKKAAEKEERERQRKLKDPNYKGEAASRGWLFLLFKWSLVAALVAVAAGQFVAGDPIWGYRGKYIQKRYWFPPQAPKERMFTPEELIQYNGRDPKKPIYLSILGNVYDVTEGKRTYGPGGMYDFFAGRDASRAYVTGCFKTHLTHDLRGLYKADLEQIMEWNRFFDTHPKYFRVGKLKLKPIDKKSPIPPSCDAPADTDAGKAAAS